MVLINDSKWSCRYDVSELIILIIEQCWQLRKWNATRSGSNLHNTILKKVLRNQLLERISNRLTFLDLFLELFNYNLFAVLLLEMADIILNEFHLLKHVWFQPGKKQQNKSPLSNYDNYDLDVFLAKQWVVKHKMW